MIYCYEDFVEALLAAGFSMGGGSSQGIYGVITWDWNQEPPYETPVRWHTGDRETDPWEWRMRVLEERDDIAYGKLFFQKSGFITKSWYPYFLAVRRQGRSLEEAYELGLITRYAKRIYEAMEGQEAMALHELKQAAAFSREEAGKFDRALVELQGKMFLTLCGRQRKRAKTGEEYGWSSTVLCKTEDFFDPQVWEASLGIPAGEAEEKIRAQVLKLNPDADAKKVMKFIRG
ncbi:MAG: hypothetical protein GXY67_01280 [Clostridiales bacterium]|nr:hypothetical protein [Clostridiales bacterium]